MRVKHIIFKVLFAILTAMSPPVHAQERPDWLENCKLEHLAEVPMTMKSGHVTISASVNGKVVTLGIDTGGPFTSLTPATAHRVGNVGHRDNLQIGNVKLDGTYTGWMEAFPGVDGLIAPDILSKYDVEFDFGANIFGLFTPHSCANRVGNSTGTYTVIPFTLTRDEHVRVPVTLDGQNMYAILDTGAPISALSMQDARR
ncbi:MAG: hypothetical protein J0H61_08200, partial [Alphaproteobacteria bacterium]|nr:hypothetical protein [Alphaproteobacteria bacterium]